MFTAFKSISGKNLWNVMVSEYLYMSKRKRANAIKVLYNWFFNLTYRANVYVAWMQASDNKLKRMLIKNHLCRKYAMLVCDTSKIGQHFRADHYFGIVIGSGAIIGDYCKMYQQVTIGQKNGKFPQIGNNVTIYPGAKIIGDIKVGDNAVIGANAVVLDDVPENAVAVGIPARIIKSNSATY